MDANFFKAFVADANLDSFLAVERDAATGLASLPAVQGNSCLGLLADRTIANHNCSVCMLGEHYAVAGAAVVEGDLLQAMTTGRLIPNAASLTTALTGANNDIVWTVTRRMQGLVGNLVNITYTDPGAPSQPLAITVTNPYSIDISLETDGAGAIVSTAADLIAAIAADATASALITGANAAGNDGSGVVTAMAQTYLAGAGCTVARALEAAAAAANEFRVFVEGGDN